MEYIKFNCFDMSSQNNELFAVSNSFHALSQKLSTVINSLDPQLKNYNDLYSAMNATNSSIKDIAERIATADKALDQIIDVYYAAEKSVLRNSEELPASLDGKWAGKSTAHGMRAAGTLKIETSAINSGDIILEDWLSELVYRSGK